MFRIDCIISIFFCTDTATPKLYTLSLHDALPIFDPDAVLGILHGGRLGHDTHGPLRRVVAHVDRSEEHTSELQSHSDLVCRLLLEKKNRIRSTVCRILSSSA